MCSFWVAHCQSQEKAINEDGEVLVGQKVKLSDIRIGQFYLYDIELTTAEELPADVVFNKALMEKVGTYKIDVNNKNIEIVK
jgi:hypothetical protein